MKKILRIFYTTVGSKKDAKEFSEKLLNYRQIVCINTFEDTKSYYRENGRITETKEIILIIKTFLRQTEIKKIIFKFHPYDIPFLSEISNNLLSTEYYKWANK